MIAAHVDFNDVRGVFFDLRKLETGSEIVVTDADDQRIRYIATNRFQVDKDDLQIPELFRTHGEHVLTLITCGGAFNTGESKYLDNIVIRAEPVTAS
ncbi:MAG: class F sortase [Candidatus Microthrix sp.]|nr:class F sortase [Candidatus Microthrix sp.]MBK9560648.1 class F sortase [Candidatus Microthrix sp.]